MHIKNISITNLKSFKEETEVSFQKGINLIVGPNSGGKSNLLEIVQALFNDVFFKDADFRRNDKNSQPQASTILPFKSELKNIDATHINNIFDAHVNGTGQSEIRINLHISKRDIENIREFQNSLPELQKFENEQIGSDLLNQITSSLDFSTEFEKYCNTDLPIIYSRNRNDLQVDNSVVNEDLKKLLHFFRWSRVIFKIAHFYKLYNSSFEMKIRPYFYYISPTRDFSLSQNEHIIDLSQVDSSSTNNFTQRNANQETRISNFGVLIRILVENYYYSDSKDNAQNIEIRNLLKTYLGMDFKIDQHGLKAENRFKISFYKIRSTSWKLSSGEREFFNLISTVFAQNITSGIIIIDEPEIHLHPKWQVIFLELLKVISKNRAIQVICVTHSASFITRDMLQNIIRVSMTDDSSEIFLPDMVKSKKTSIKDQFMLVTASNNERIFFADRVILVEGYSDRIIFEAIMDKVYEKDKPIVEIVDVYGKNNFERYRKFLSIWNVPSFIVADLDYLSAIDSKARTSIFSFDESKMIKKVGRPSSEDGKSLLKVLEGICVGNQELEKDSKNKLCQMYEYLSSRHTFSTLTGSAEQVDEYVEKYKKDGVYLLKKGEIEDYFQGVGKFEIDTAITIAEQIRSGDKEVDPELKKIIQDIVQDKDVSK